MCFDTKTLKEKYVLRQVSHSHHKTTSDLGFELAFLDYLKNAGYPFRVPSAIPTQNGRLFVTVQDHYYWLYKFLEGTVVSRLNGSHLTQLARMMATYHLLIERSNLHNGKQVSDLYNRTAILKEIDGFRTEILKEDRPKKYEVIFLDESARLTRVVRGLDESRYLNV